jgi:hypothetical protein
MNLQSHTPSSNGAAADQHDRENLCRKIGIVRKHLDDAERAVRGDSLEPAFLHTAYAESMCEELKTIFRNRLTAMENAKS